MNNELLSILSFLERDRGIDRETLIQAVEFALQSAARKSTGEEDDTRVEIDRKTCDIRAFAKKVVTEEKTRDQDTICLEEAREIDPDLQIDASEHLQIIKSGRSNDGGGKFSLAMVKFGLNSWSNPSGTVYCSCLFPRNFLNLSISDF